MIRAWFVLALVAAAGQAFDSLEDELLLRFQENVRQDLSRVPDYTCLETIERSQRARKAEQFTIVDTIRLEVSEAGGKELYAWPGGHFRDTDTSHFVLTGIISTGEFTDQARLLFLGHAGSMSRAGEESLGGRRSIRYGFQIPQSFSRYLLKTPAGSARVGYHGWFWLDPATLDLLRLEVLVDQIPPALRLREVSTRIDYARAQAVSNALLPLRGELTMIAANGEGKRNVIHFSSCRQYQAESSLRFDVPAESAAEPARPPVRDVQLPAGLLVTLVLDTAIDPTTAVIGDEIRAHLTGEVRDRGESVLPKDARMTGRIRRLDRRGSGKPFLVVFEFTGVEWEQTRAAFRAELVESGTFPGRRGTGNAFFGAGLGVIGVDSGKSIPAGLNMVWRTLYPKVSP